MPKVISPEVLALVPNGIENFVLRCCVCGEPLPPRRRTIGHHIGPCAVIRRMYRRYLTSTTKCVSCLHPSTPEEREDFKHWRRDRGQLKVRGGRQKGQKYPRKTLTVLTFADDRSTVPDLFCNDSGEAQ